MRMLLKVQMEVEAANQAIKDGSLPKIIQGFTEAAKPEGVWFTAVGGKRTMVAVFDLASPAQIPPLAEPFFTGLNASFTPRGSAVRTRRRLPFFPIKFSEFLEIW